MCANTKSNLETIEDFILNQNKIVTYRWLSQKLKIHANTSKQLLYTYSLKNTDDNLLITYLISGTTQDGGVRVFVVNQSEVDKVKSSLDTVISEHVYSIQKSSSSVSSSDVYLADSFVGNNSFTLSSISPRVVEHREFKVVLPDIPSAAPKPLHPPSKSEQKISPSSKQEKSKVASPTKHKDKANVVSPVKNSKKAKENLIGIFLSKQNTLNAEKKNKDTPSHEELVIQKPPAENETKSKIISPTRSYKKNKGTNIETLFSKQSALNAEKKKRDFFSEKEEEKQGDDKKNENEAMEEEDGRQENSDNALEQCEKIDHKTPIDNQKKVTKSRKNKRKSKQDCNTPARKRKRIVLASDSESGSEQEEDMNVEEEPEPEETIQAEVPDSDDEVIPPTPIGEKVKRKVRKQVDKTFTDEEGFIVTKKEYVYESCSDEEPPKNNDNFATPKKPNEEDKINGDIKQSNEGDDNNEDEARTDNSVKPRNKGKPEKKNAKGKAKSPKKGSLKSSNKQSSITSFFSKK